MIPVVQIQEVVVTSLKDVRDEYVGIACDLIIRKAARLAKTRLDDDLDSAGDTIRANRIMNKIYGTWDYNVYEKEELVRRASSNLRSIGNGNYIHIDTEDNKILNEEIKSIMDMYMMESIEEVMGGILSE